jgi:hypothetical protein
LYPLTCKQRVTVSPLLVARISQDLLEVLEYSHEVKMDFSVPSISARSWFSREQGMGLGGSCLAFCWALRVHAKPVMKPTLLLLTMCLTVVAQQRPATIAGRAFIITPSGDQKLARLATVTALWDSRELDDDEEGSVGRKFHNFLDALRSSRPFPSENGDSCLEALMMYSHAVGKTVDWTNATNHVGQLKLARSDEEGRFSLNDLHSGIYELIVLGRAGFDEAVWWEPLVKVKSGSVVTLKLSHPEFSCESPYQ